MIPAFFTMDQARKVQARTHSLTSITTNHYLQAAAVQSFISCSLPGSVNRQIHQLPASGVPRQNAAGQNHAGVQVFRHTQRW